MSSPHCKIQLPVLVFLFNLPFLVPPPPLSLPTQAWVTGAISMPHITGRGGGHCHWLPGGGSVGGTSRRLEGRRREIKAFLPGILSSFTPSFWQCLHLSGIRAPTGQPLFWAPVLNTGEDHGFLLLFSRT